MRKSSFSTLHVDNELSFNFEGELSIYEIADYEKEIDSIDFNHIKNVTIDLSKVSFLDSASSILIFKLKKN
jgi:anti-anti-sigma regulatory factor